MYNVLCSRLDRRKYPLVIESEEEEEEKMIFSSVYTIVSLFIYFSVQAICI